MQRNGLLIHSLFVTELAAPSTHISALLAHANMQLHAGIAAGCLEVEQWRQWQLAASMELHRLLRAWSCTDRCEHGAAA
jgi:hypothetical protein